MYRRVDFLPDVPNKLIPDVSTFIQNPTVSFGQVFKVFDVDPVVTNYLQPFIKFKASIRWQIVSGDLPIHYDTGSSSEKYIYLIDKGGRDVYTTFWSTKDNDPLEGGIIEQEDRRIVMKISEEINQWHLLNVKKPHSVTGIEGIRYALIIRPS